MKRDFFDNFDIPEEYSQFGLFGKYTWYVENVINEGLITSYPFSSLIIHLRKKYLPIITYIRADPFSKDIKSKNLAGISMFINKSEYNESTMEKIKKDVDVYGYIVAFVEPYNDKEISIFIEPKYPSIIDKSMLRNKHFYHITHKDYLDKIKRIGLTPRDSQTNFNHSGNRIYLMASINRTISDKFKSKIASSKGWKEDEMITLQISPELNAQYYIDPNFNNDYTDKIIAVFTLKNIPPSRITVI
jgi:hypothetical protein